MLNITKNVGVAVLTVARDGKTIISVSHIGNDPH